MAARRGPWTLAGRLIGRLLRNRDGAAAVEFGLVILPFCVMIFAILEVALIFTLDSVLEKLLPTDNNYWTAFERALADEELRLLLSIAAAGAAPGRPGAHAARRPSRPNAPRGSPAAVPATGRRWSNRGARRQ